MKPKWGGISKYMGLEKTLAFFLFSHPGIFLMEASFCFSRLLNLAFLHYGVELKSTCMIFLMLKIEEVWIFNT